MKISGITTAPCTGPRGVASKLAMLQLETDQGVSGSAVGGLAEARMAERLASEFLRGADPRATVMLHCQLTSWAENKDDPMPLIRAVAMLDLALWDIKARSAGEPLWRALGGGGRGARASVHLTGWPAAPDEREPWLQQLAGRPGYGAASMEIGTHPDGLAELLAATWRVLAGNDPLPDLTLHCPGDWSLAQALAVLAACERDVDIARVQVPAGRWRSEELRSLSEQIAAAVSESDDLPADGGLFPRLGDFARDVLVIDPTLRGVTGSLQLAEAAYGFELPVVLAATPGNWGGQLAGAIPNLVAVEVRPEAAAPGLQSPMRVVDGRLEPGDGPGHGLVAGTACGTGAE